jgi:hypothetical protein
LKTFYTPDGGGYNCTLYRDGKRVAEIHDGGHGGEIEIEIAWLDRSSRIMNVEAGYCTYPEETILLNHVKGMYYPADTALGIKENSLTMGTSGFIGELVSDFEFEKKVRRLIKNSTCYRTKPQGSGEFWTIKAPFTAAVKARIQKDEPALVEIYNETYGQVAK